MPEATRLEPARPFPDAIFDSFVIVVSILLFSAVAAAIYSLVPKPGDVSLLFAAWNRNLLSPETAERLAYIVGLAYFLVLPTLLSLAVGRFLPGIRAYLSAARAGGIGWGGWLSVLLGVWALAVSLRTMKKFNTYPLFFFCAAAAVLLVKFLPRWHPSATVEGRGRYYTAGFFLLLAAGSAALMFVDEGILALQPGVSDSFYVLLATITQVFHGHTVLVDMPSQYGVLYPYLGALVVSLFGFSIKPLSVFFVSLVFLSLCFILLAMYRKLRFSALSALLAAAVVGLSHPFYYAAILGINPYHMAPYYAYLPIRVVFGAFMLYFSKLYLDSPSAGKYLAGTAVAGAAVLWNMDTGLVLVLSWLALLAYRELSQRRALPESLLRILGHAAAAAFAVLLWGGVYALFAKYRSGAYPDWGMAGRYQALFYKSGFMMLRMKLFDLWQVPLLVYAVTLYKTVEKLARREMSAQDNWYFYIAVYGLGIFSYFQGRSHIFCLTAVVYPAAMLIAFYAHDLITSLAPAVQTSPGDGLWRRAVLAALLCPLLLSLYALSAGPGYLLKLAKESGRTNVSSELADAVAFLRENNRDSGVLVLSTSADKIYFLSGSASPLPLASLAEVILQEDVAKVQALIDSGRIKYVLRGEGYPGLAQNLTFPGFNPAAPLRSFSVLVRVSKPPRKGGGT